MRIQFLRRVQYENEGRNKGPMFEKDAVHDFPDAFAQRWLRRGVAVMVAAAAMPAKETSESVKGESTTDDSKTQKRTRGE